MPIELIQQAERLGYDSVWTAEAYGCDAVTPLAFIAARPSGSASAPDHAAGRPAAGDVRHAGGDRRRPRRRRTGSSPASASPGPQIVEGWYGEPWGKPVLAAAGLHPDHAQDLRREAPVVARGTGDLAALRRAGCDRAGQAPAVHPAHERRPPDLARQRAAGDGQATASCATAGCRCTSCRAAWTSTGRGWRKGLRRAGGGAGRDLEIFGRAAVQITDDIAGGAAPGPEARHRAVRRRHGPPRPQLPQRAHGARATATSPTGAGAVPRGPQGRGGRRHPRRVRGRAGLYGPPERIEQRYPAWADSGITGLTIDTHRPEAVELMAKIAL